MNKGGTVDVGGLFRATMVTFLSLFVYVCVSLYLSPLCLCLYLSLSYAPPSSSQVNAVHSGSCGHGPDLFPGGEAAGWIINCPNGRICLHACMHRDRQRERQTERDRQIETETETERDRETERQTELRRTTNKHECPCSSLAHKHSSLLCAGHTIYHSGDTDVFGDMRLISDLYRPDIALLCIGGQKMQRFDSFPLLSVYLSSLSVCLSASLPLYLSLSPSHAHTLCLCLAITLNNLF